MILIIHLGKIIFLLFTLHSSSEIHFKWTKDLDVKGLGGKQAHGRARIFVILERRRRR